MSVILLERDSYENENHRDYCSGSPDAYFYMGRLLSQSTLSAICRGAEPNSTGEGSDSLFKLSECRIYGSKWADTQ